MSLVASLFYPGLSRAMGSLSPQPAHCTCTCTQSFHLSPSLPLGSLPDRALAATGQGGWALGPPSCKWTLQTPSATRSHILSPPKTKARNDKIKHNPDHPTSPDTSQTHILPKMFLVCCSCPPNACDNASHESSSPSGDGVACSASLSLLLPHTHTQSGTIRVLWLPGSPGRVGSSRAVSPYWVP